MKVKKMGKYKLFFKNKTKASVLILNFITQVFCIYTVQSQRNKWTSSHLLKIKLWENKNHAN